MQSSTFIRMLGGLTVAVCLLSTSCNALLGNHEGVDRAEDAGVDASPSPNDATALDQGAGPGSDATDVPLDLSADMDVARPTDVAMERTFDRSVDGEPPSVDAPSTDAADAAVEPSIPPTITDAPSDSPSDSVPPPTCTDRVRNGDETDIDCGGSCPPCGLGGACSTSSDCVTGRCAGLDGGSCTPWSKLLQATMYTYANDIAIDANGNLIVVGYYGGTPSGDLGDLPSQGTLSNGFVLKYSPDGSLLWRRVHAYAGWKRVAIDSTGKVVVFGAGSPASLDDGGQSADSHDLLLAKLEPAGGDAVWFRHFGGVGTEESEDLALGPDDSIAIAAQSYGGGWSMGGTGTVPSVPVGASIAIFARLDTAGNPLWSQFVFYGGPVYALGAVLDPAGNLDFSGVMAGAANADAGAGYVADAGAPLRGGDIFIGQFAKPNGARNWSKSYAAKCSGSNQGPNAARIAVGDGGPLVAGVINDPVTFGDAAVGVSGLPTFYAARFDANGGVQWVSSAGPCPLRNNERQYNSLRARIDPAGRPLVYGSFVCSELALDVKLVNAGPLGRDFFVSRLDPGTGAFVLTRHWGTADDEQLERVAVHAKTGNLFLVGEFSNQLDLGGGTMTKPNAASLAAFVASVGP